MVNRAIVVGVLLTSAAAYAGPVDAMLCQRVDDRFDGAKPTILSINRVAGPSVAADDTGKVTVCKDAAKKSCSTFNGKTYNSYGINADATLLVASGEDSLKIEDAATGKVKRTIKSKRDKEYSCGAGIWMGDTLLAFGQDCHEFDALPFLVNGKTGKYIGPLVDKKLTTDGETLYDGAQLDGKLWAVAVFNHDDQADLGKVYVLDVTTGKATDTITRTKEQIAKLPACTK